MSKKISEFTLKNSVSPNDVLAILDSESGYENKKILASAISGGSGDYQYYHELKNVQMTFTYGAYQVSRITAECDGLTVYEDGIYVLKSPATNSGYSGYGVTLNINNLGARTCILLNGTSSGGASSNPLESNYFTSGGCYIFVFNSSNNTFYNVYSQTLPLRQHIDTSSDPSPNINLSLLNEIHRCYKYTSPLNSLTLNLTPPINQGFETEFQFTTGSTFTFSATDLVGKWIGGVPTFEPNKSYVIAIKNGLAAWGEVS